MRNKSFNQDEILAAIEKEVSHEPECELFFRDKYFDCCIDCR
jgi:hypothetical protein